MSRKASILHHALLTVDTHRDAIPVSCIHLPSPLVSKGESRTPGPKPQTPSFMTNTIGCFGGGPTAGIFLSAQEAICSCPVLFRGSRQP